VLTFFADPEFLAPTNVTICLTFRYVHAAMAVLTRTYYSLTRLWFEHAWWRFIGSIGCANRPILVRIESLSAYHTAADRAHYLDTSTSVSAELTEPPLRVELLGFFLFLTINASAACHNVSNSGSS
jgi:hypothetical protein